MNSEPAEDAGRNASNYTKIKPSGLWPVFLISVTFLVIGSKMRNATVCNFSLYGGVKRKCDCDTLWWKYCRGCMSTPAISLKKGRHISLWPRCFGGDPNLSFKSSQTVFCSFWNHCTVENKNKNPKTWQKHPIVVQWGPNGWADRPRLTLIAPWKEKFLQHSVFSHKHCHIKDETPNKNLFFKKKKWWALN